MNLQLYVSSRLPRLKIRFRENLELQRPAYIAWYLIQQPSVYHIDCVPALKIHSSANCMPIHCTTARDVIMLIAAEDHIRGPMPPPSYQSKLPTYAELPVVPNMPHGCTWGMWDREGHPDELGTLNLLTPSTILAAKDEIQYGRSVAINWSLDNCETPHSNRKKPAHRILQLPDWIGHDDEVEMNTQSGSQWDGLRKYRVGSSPRRELL